MLKSEIAGLTYRSKENKDASYSGPKKTPTQADKDEIAVIRGHFLASIISRHSS
jgi:hypothetical protein